MNYNANNDKLDMERVWKEFGKNTEAGKLLYNIYGVNYKPENHINYPKLVMKTPEMKERESHKDIIHMVKLTLCLTGKIRSKSKEK